MMSGVNWWLMDLAFALGLLLTFAGTVHRVKREVPIYEALGRGPGVGDVEASATTKLRKVDGDATAKLLSGAATGAVAAGAAAAGGAAVAKLAGGRVGAESDTAKLSTVGDEPYGRFRSVGAAYVSAERVPVVIRDAIVLGALQSLRRTWRYRGRLAAAAVTAFGGAGIALGVAQSSGAFGRALIVAFVLVAPALAIIRLLPSVHGAVAVIVAAAGAAVINALVAQLMVSANAWSPPAGVIAVGLTAALLWLVPTGGPHARTHP
jgi:hypothetical protein